MTTDRKPRTMYRLAVCADCLDTDANGANPEHTPDREPLGLLAPGTLLGPDLPAHADDAAYDTWSEGHFSWAPCGACGSTLGGTRWDMIAVEVSA
jgi:hypothetical protein